MRTTYDAAGNATGINNTTTSTVATITFDAQNRATGQSFTGGLNPSSLASSATYDRAGRILTLSDGGTGASNTTTYTYDASNNVITLAEPGGSCPATPAFPNSTKCTKFSYDDNNQRTVTTFPNGVTSTVGYDNSQRWASQTVKNSSGTTLLSRTWTYTSATNADTALVNSETDNAGNKITYGYDGANQLKTAVRKSSGGTTLWNGAWTLDNNGNRTQQVINGTTTNYKYNAADQLCWYGTGTSSSCTAPSGATTLSYDANGNQTGSATYTAFNQQATTTGSVSYAYLGTTNTQRLAAGGVAYTPNVVTGQTTQHTGSSTQKIIRDPGGKLIAWQTGGASYYYVTDRQDSVLLLTDGSQAKVAEYGYLPYGNTYTNTGSQAAGNPYRYIGTFLDGTGNYKMGARYYNPTIGRFTQPDPSGQEFNRYNYAGSNPVTYADPSGLYPEVDDSYTDEYDGSDPRRDYCSGVPNYYGDADFRGACAAHDTCYDSYSKLYCDAQFAGNMQATCAESYGWFNPSRYMCAQRAAYYTDGVLILGGW